MTKASGKPAKTLNVQVPGGTPTEATSNPAPQADAQAEPVSATPSARRYRDMHSSKIDAATLTAPVLCEDGWLCPNVPAKK